MFVDSPSTPFFLIFDPHDKNRSIECEIIANVYRVAQHYHLMFAEMWTLSNIHTPPTHIRHYNVTSTWPLRDSNMMRSCSVTSWQKLTGNLFPWTTQTRIYNLVKYMCSLCDAFDMVAAAKIEQKYWQTRMVHFPRTIASLSFGKRLTKLKHSTLHAKREIFV